MELKRVMELFQDTYESYVRYAFPVDKLKVYTLQIYQLLLKSSMLHWKKYLIKIITDS